jgi:hypothetical protein
MAADALAFAHENAAVEIYPSVVGEQVDDFFVHAFVRREGET